MQCLSLRIRGTHRYSFRSGEWAALVGYVMVIPDDSNEPRQAFMVRYNDGTVDYIPVSDANNYEIAA